MKIFAENGTLKNAKFAGGKRSVLMAHKEKDNTYTKADEHCCSKEAAARSVKYYLQNTTLHGLKYIAETRITIAERIFFGLAFIMVTILSGFFISNIYVKWSANPIIITTSAKQVLGSDLPFPAITICNLNQALKSKVQTISRQSANFSLLMSICDQGDDTQITFTGIWRYFKRILTEVAQSCEEMLLFCSFGALVENCSLIFNSVLTDDGLCCTFNALDPIYLLQNYTDDNSFSPTVDNHFVPIDWTPEKGYDKDLPRYFYPRYSGGTGSRMGLTVILNASASEYYCTKSKSVGFKVLVHSPAELPKISNYGFLVTAGREARVPIEPIYQDAMPSIRSIKKQVRRCLFSDEGDLVYYRTYSRQNCELECEATILITQCNCVLYYLPRIDPTIRICGPNDNLCTNEVQAKIESSDKNVSCDNCYPGCFELTYRSTMTATTIVYENFLTADSFPNHIFNGSGNISDISVLNFYYLSNIFRSTTKSEMFGFTEFLSNTGGLLGLFMGFSIFSVIELIYYITVRPYCANRTMDLARRKKQEEIKWITPVKRRTYRSGLFVKDNFMNEPLKKPENKNYNSFMRNILMKQSKDYATDKPIHPYIN